MFTIQAQVKEGKICLVESPDTFISYIMSLFEKVINDLARFRSIEDFIINLNQEAKETQFIKGVQLLANRP